MIIRGLYKLASVSCGTSPVMAVSVVRYTKRLDRIGAWLTLPKVFDTRHLGSQCTLLTGFVPNIGAQLTFLLLSLKVALGVKGICNIFCAVLAAILMATVATTALRTGIATVRIPLSRLHWMC